MEKKTWIFGPIRMDLVRQPGKQTILRMRDTSSNRSCDLRGCQRSRLQDVIREYVVITDDDFFRIGERLIDEGCRCENPRCNARQLNANIAVAK